VIWGVRDVDLVLKAPVGLAEVVQEGDRREPLDQPLVAERQAGRQQQPLAQQRVLEQRLQGGGDIGTMVDERMPLKMRRLGTRPAKLPGRPAGPAALAVPAGDGP
jgi:hypothetical protein